VGAAAVLVWGPGLAFGLLAGSHLVFNLAAVFLSDDVGAGNSGATFGLGATIAGLALVRTVLQREGPAWVLVAMALGVVLVGVVLIVLGDAHGIPMAGGVVLGALASPLARARRVVADSP